MMRQVRVQLFARLRELAGADVVMVPLRERGTVADLRSSLDRLWPAQQAALARRSAVAVNGEYAADEQALATSDEIALIPPVSGG